jgi:ATP-dependent RNA circularization protein (DNA/RNA ligase family)
LPQEKRDAYEGGSIYWDLAFKYDIENVLRDLIRVYNCEWVVIQGEGIGSVQGNPLKMDHDDLYVFNLITSEHGRFGSYEGREVLDQYGMKWVPIYGDVTLPDNMEAMKLQADGNSVINPNVLREGLVYRTPDGMESFKNVSREYLLKKK